MLSLTFILGLSTNRIYPFSDFSMFANLRSDSKVEGLVVKTVDGKKQSIKYSLISPFTGLNIRQFSRGVLYYNGCTDWIGYFGKKAKQDNPTLTAVVVQDIVIRFDSDKRTWTADLDSPVKEIEFPL